MARSCGLDRLPLGSFRVAGLVGVFCMMTLAVPAGAQDDASTEEPGVGTESVPPAVVCTVGGPLEIGIGVDCIIDLGALDLGALDLGAGDLDGPDGAVDLFSVGLLDQTGEYWPCEGEGPLRVCSSIGRERFDLVARSFDLEIITRTEQLVIDDVATIETVTDPQTVLFSFIDTDEPVVFEGRPLPIELFSIADLPTVFVTVRERGETDVVASIEVTAPQRDRSVSERLELDLPPGRYRLWTCVGPTSRTCDEVPGGHAFQVIDPKLHELVPGHNRPRAQRINMVFAGSRLGAEANLQRIATDMLTLDGPDIGLYDLRYGPMSIEPLASNRHRFNFWYLDADLGDERSLLFDGTDPLAAVGFALGDAPLRNMAVTVLYGPGYGPSDARITSFWNQVDVPDADSLRFAGARVSIDVDDPLERATTLAHEWGHSLFELRDEYVDFSGRQVVVGYPNCAPDPEEAASWWGTRTGDIDPFVYEVLRARRAAGFTAEPREGNLATNVRVGLHSGGCYDGADARTAFRPTLDSLMSSEIPVFGSVNRSRVEEVLDRFSGRGPLTDLETVSLRCERESGVVSCEGTLDRYLDPPGRRVALDSRSCELSAPQSASSDGADGLSTIVCRVRSESGSVELTLGSQRWSVPVVDRVEPETSDDAVTGLDGDGPVGEPDRGSGRQSRTWALVGTGAITVLFLLRVGRTAWRHRT